MARECMSCGKRIGLLTEYVPLKDGRICLDCFFGLGIKGFVPGLEFQERYDRGYAQVSKQLMEVNYADLADAVIKINEEDAFPTSRIGNVAIFHDGIGVLKVGIGCKSFYKPDEYASINYDQIIGYNVTENGNNIRHNGWGAAAIGGLAFGPVGALVGALATTSSVDYCFSMSVHIMVNDPDNPSYLAEFVSGKIARISPAYKEASNHAQQLAAKLEVILRENEERTHRKHALSNQGPATPSANIDQLRGYKALLDEGVITQEDYNRVKQQVLGI